MANFLTTLGYFKLLVILFSQMQFHLGANRFNRVAPKYQKVCIMLSFVCLEKSEHF